MPAQVHSSPNQSHIVQLELLLGDAPKPELAKASGAPGSISSAKRRRQVAEQDAMLPLQGHTQPPPPIADSLILSGPAKPLPASKFDQGTTLNVMHLASADSAVTRIKDVKAENQAECPQNLEVVMATITADVDLTSRQRTDFKSALRGLARVTGRDLALIPTAPGALRELFISVLPVAHGITPGRWLHIRSRVTRAVQRAGAPIMPGRFSSTFTFAWKQLSEALPNKRAKIGLSRFIRFCAARGIEPADVTQTVFDAFFKALQMQTVIRSPAHSYRTTCLEWNSAGGVVPGWPPLRAVLLEDERRYALDWSAFPASFRGDADAYFTRAANPDPFEDGVLRRLKPSTVQLQRRQVRQMASLLVQSGISAEEITNLAVLAKIENAKRLLKAAQKRLGEKSPHLSGMSQLLTTLAKKWCHSPAATAKGLAAFTALATPKKAGVTNKNRKRLRQFDDPESLIALWEMPEMVFARLAKKANPDLQAAREALYALAVAFLCAIPLRAGNLFALDRTRHIVAVGRGRHRVWHLVIPSCEMKNEEAIEAHLPPKLCALLEVYQTRYVPLLCSAPTDLLFPNEKGKIRDLGTAGTTMCRFVRSETGLVINPHLFRHLAVTSYLHHHPEDLETARRILGHKNISTTMRHYAYLRTPDAFHRLSVLIERLRDGSTLGPRQGKRVGKGAA